MDSGVTNELLGQHVSLLQKLDLLQTAIIVLIFVMIAFMGFMFALAGWSVYTVNRRQAETIDILAKRQTGVETSWKEVLELLLHNVRHGSQ